MEVCVSLQILFLKSSIIEEIRSAISSVHLEIIFFFPREIKFRT